MQELPVQTVNDFPYWSQVAYGDIDENIKTYGCGPTSIAMVLKALGKDVAPNQLRTQCKGHGYNEPGGTDKGNLFPYISKTYNVSVEKITSFEKCCELARQGYPIVLDGKKDPGTTWHKRCLKTCYGPSGHYVVLVAMSGNDVVINDPRGVFSSGIRPREHASSGFFCGFKIGDKKFNLDSSKFKKLGSEDGAEPGDNGNTGNDSGNNTPSEDNSGGNYGSGSGNSITVIYNNTTTVQESLPNANVSDNWVDMHKIKGITLHMYPPYHDCTADSMAKYFESLGWDRNFHYKVDKDTKIDFNKKPASGQTTGGNIVGSSLSDFEVKPKDPLNQTVIINGENVTVNNGNIGGGNNDSTDGSTPEEGKETEGINKIDGNDIPTKIYNYCISQGCSVAAACGIVGNAETESSFDPKNVNRLGATGLFQLLGDRATALKNYAKKAGKEWSDPDIQIQYMWIEWSGDSYIDHLRKSRYNMTLDSWKKITDPKQAAKIFGHVFERAEDGADGTGVRGKYAQKWYDKFSNSSGSKRIRTKTFSTFANRSYDQEQISAYANDYGTYLNDEITVQQQSEPFGWPAPMQTYIQSYFGYRTDTLGYNYHPGIDIANYTGSGAFCYADGVVKKVLAGTKLKGYVRIDHGNKVQTVYGSLDEIKVKEGDTVTKGQCIGTTDVTVSNPLMHLHFEMLIDGKHVDPLDYVKPGGGYKKNPFPQVKTAMFALTRAVSTNTKNTNKTVSNTTDKKVITWDKVDKGKICFASADNNTHTYIDANLFNNQHPKYTLSIGEFFYDEYDLVEKTGNVDYPKTEKKLIEQCAKALYDEGFTSKQLWREFDLNRAPSPFLYLDKDKWIAFCKEVDKQVSWLNKKYGKVTSTYIPNNLLTNQNTNNFIETAPLPNGVIVPGNNDNNNNNNNNNSKPVDIKNALFIGDSWGVGIEKLVEADGGISEANSGKSFLYYYNDGSTDKLKSMKKDPSFIYIFLGLNDLKTNSEHNYVNDFYKRVKQLWPKTKVYVSKLIHAGTAWSNNKYNAYGNIDDWNKAVDKFNERLSGICSSNGFELIDISDGLIDSKGYLDSSLATQDGIHLKDWQKYYNNIKNAIGALQPNSNNGQKGSGNFIWPLPGSTRISSNFGPRKAPVPGASTFHRGLDIPASKGTKVIAADSGKVVVAKTGHNGGRGNYVVIDHGNGIGTLYQHLNKYIVTVGQSVKQGDKIAEVGNTGIGTGPHLHFEVHKDFSGTKGTPVNPLNYVSPNGKKSNPSSHISANNNAKSAAVKTFAARKRAVNAIATIDDDSDTEEIYPTQYPGLFIGDNWEYEMRDLIVGDSNELEGNYFISSTGETYSICEAAISKDSSYYYNPTKNIDRLEGMNKNVSFVYIHLGYNRLKENLESNDTVRFLNKVKELYSNVPVYVAKLPHCGKRYSGQDYKSADAFNEALDKYNNNLKSYCIKNGFYFIDISKDLMDSEGYLKDSIVNSDGITLNNYITYYNNIKSIIESTTNITMVTEIFMAGDIDHYDEPKEESHASTFAMRAPKAKNDKQYCYVGNTSGTEMKKDAKEKAGKVAKLAVGDELEITGEKNTYYKCKFNKKTGYVLKEDVVTIGKNHGEVSQSYVGQTCWIKFENTDYYKDTKLTKQNKDLSEQTKAVIIGTDVKLGLYKIKTNDTSGYVKAYAVTFDSSDFKVSNEKDPGDEVIKPDNGEEKNNNSSGNLDLVSLKNADFEEDDISMWSKMGSIEFSRIVNPEWGTKGHWPYRKTGFARIKNASSKISGISQNFDAGDSKCYLRVLFYIKQVTQKDENSGPLDPDKLKQTNISIKLLDKSDKVKYEKEVDISGISNTIWTRIGCIFSGLEDSSYKLFIGSKNKFDLYVDDITIEKIYKNNIDNTIGDSSSTSGITLSGLGTTSIDNGGVMIYKVAKPTEANATKPDIKTIITQKEYEEIMTYSTAANIDIYTNSFEPYDKDLAEVKSVGLNSDSRLEVLTEKIYTFTDNMIRYKVVETGPGSIDHCVKPVDELSVLYKNMNCKVDPIYPDLVIPPKYTTSTYDSMSKNSIPLSTVEDATISLEDALDKSYSYDYKLLDKKTKKSSGKPINYMDPYPYDDKITDLENHYPKVLIDEIENRVYSCNHPGCPIAHPMAKNFAMLNDMAINQSKMTEQRLVRIENILSTVTRYLGRMASRVNINCVYYGGQTVLGKYKCIRCLRDDRVHDGATVTMDQCLTCTRYEPIIGQIYDILDETGFNGSAILDDMQMSYMSLDDFKNLNDVEKRSSRYSYIDTNKKEKKKPKSLIDEWQATDKKLKEKEIKKKYTDKEERTKELDKLLPSDYLFMMDWTEESVDLQRPDIKAYPTEKIAAKYKNQKGDPGEDNVALAEKSTQMGTDKKTYNTIASGEWIDTREKDDSVQSNKYTSLDFYFENFNLNRTGYEYDNGIKGNVGLTYSGGSNSIDNSVNGNGAEIRKKITEMAQTIVKEYKDGKAKYSNSPRTIDHDKPQKCSDGKIGYDCTSFVSCCYKAAGLSDFYDGRTGQGSAGSNTLAQEVVKKGGKIWFADKDGMAKALPGDVLMTYGSAKIDKNKLSNGSGCKASHAIIYMGDGMIAHSSSPSSGIKYEKADYYVTGKHAGHSYFLRPQSLIDADKASSDNGGSGIDETAGEIDGVKYIMALKGSKCTQYKEGEGGYKDALGNRLYSSKCNTVASHNLPYGTKVYIPYFKGKQTANPSCIFTVTDTGNAGFDFDICCPASVYYGNGRMDVYVVSWGSGKGTAASVTYCYKHMAHSETLWRDYVRNGGTTYKVTKFCKDDVNITSQSFWTKYK